MLLFVVGEKPSFRSPPHALRLMPPSVCSARLLCAPPPRPPRANTHRPAVRARRPPRGARRARPDERRHAAGRRRARRAVRHGQVRAFASGTSRDGVWSSLRPPPPRRRRAEFVRRALTHTCRCLMSTRASSSPPHLLTRTRAYTPQTHHTPNYTTPNRSSSLNFNLIALASAE